jgi:uncharacterized protein YciI
LSTKYVLLYESADDVLEKVPVHYPAHSAYADRFHEAGTLELIGAFGDPRSEGSMAIFNTREAAEEFVAGDPFVLNEVVKGYEIREWQEAYS